MSAEIKKYKARIFGEFYVVVSDEAEENVAEVVMLVDRMMKEISSKHSGGVDAKQVAVLTALRATQELLALQKQLQLEQIRLEKITTLINEEEALL